MVEFLQAINNVLWSTPVIYILLLIGLTFSVLTRFLQLRYIKEMFALMFKGKSSEAGVSSFQALSVALAGRVGTGNIAGVATAIYYGGPGAVFWMWTIAFLGASSAFIESTLAQIYKVKQGGLYRGGPAFYIEKGIGIKWFAVLFAIAALLAMSFLMPGVQSNSIAVAMNNAFTIPNWVTGLILIVFLALIIFGGIKRIASTAAFLVPFMAIGYMIMAIIIIALNITEIPATISLIISSAFGMDSIFGGLLGSAISWGVIRGIYSNEAGQGTGPHPAAAAEVSHPAKQGLVQAASVYIDTLLVCSATAFMILFTGLYNTEAPDGTMIVNNLPGVEVGPGFTQEAINSVFSGFGTGFVAIALLFFAFTTIMAYYYIAETNVTYLLRGRQLDWPILLVKLALLVATFYGALRTADTAWLLGDIGLGIMVWLNIIAIVILAKPALRTLKDYERQKEEGLDPVFNPKDVDIQNADFWESYQTDNKQEAQKQQRY
ncbi:alanine:cation symporter family protein [Alkalihalobacillus oceani]|uniref:alanine/glycine:cation symporter family protein n=1 Tax=Halalkalibacter oceani TaxID=1653776 RepID=UPI002042578B|nr:alanine/glycine:cation symporter family protein [Halalkalibacter oceani]MCM3760289.1 alanine:cation symporter family protein [Halalkalibacter oceani]